MPLEQTLTEVEPIFRETNGTFQFTHPSFQEVLTAKQFADEINFGSLSIEDAYVNFWSYEEDKELWGLPSNKAWRALLPALRRPLLYLAGILKEKYFLDLVGIIKEPFKESCNHNIQYNPFYSEVLFIIQLLIKEKDYRDEFLQEVRECISSNNTMPIHQVCLANNFEGFGTIMSYLLQSPLTAEEISGWLGVLDLHILVSAKETCLKQGASKERYYQLIRSMFPEQVAHLHELARSKKPPEAGLLIEALDDFSCLEIMLNSDINPADDWRHEVIDYFLSKLPDEELMQYLNREHADFIAERECQIRGIKERNYAKAGLGWSLTKLFKDPWQGIKSHSHTAEEVNKLIDDTATCELTSTPYCSAIGMTHLITTPMMAQVENRETICKLLKKKYPLFFKRERFTLGTYGVIYTIHQRLKPQSYNPPVKKLVV